MTVDELQTALDEYDENLPVVYVNPQGQARDIDVTEGETPDGEPAVVLSLASPPAGGPEAPQGRDLVRERLARRR
jgi:hypothetical protein